MAKRRRRRKKKAIMKDCGTAGVSTSKVLNSNSKQPWFKQGYLMMRAPELVPPLRQHHKQNSYIKQVNVPKSQGSSLVNMLTTNPSILGFFDGRPVDYGQLAPHIQLYKVYIHNNGKGPEDVEEFLFPFRSFEETDEWDATSYKRENKKQFFRGPGAGIKDISIKMEGRGRNPVSANIMDITIKYFFSDVKTLFKDLGIQKGKSKSKIRYADLISYPPSMRKKRSSFRIRLVVGWSTNSENPIWKDKDFAQAINGSRMSVAADLYTHDMEFNEDGSLVLTAQYKGALESTFSGQAANILHNVSINSKGDTNLNDMKDDLREKEQRFLEGRMNASDQAAWRNLEKIEETLKQLAAMRNAIDKAFEEGKGNNPSVADQGNFRKKYTEHADAIENYGKGRTKSPFKQLRTLTNSPLKKENITQSDIERKNQSKLAEEKAKLKKRATRKKRLTGKQKTLSANIRGIKKKIAKYEQAMKGKHIFSYVEYMRLNNKIAWIPTGRRSEFGDFQKLVELLNREGGTENSRGKITRAENKVEKSSKPEQVKGKLDKNKKGKPLRSLSEAFVWEGLSKKPAYKSGDKMYFFRLGDLLTSILDTEGFAERLSEEAPDFKLLLGQYSIRNKNDSLTKLNLYELPISLEIFHVFVAQKIVGAGRSTYPLLKFTFDLIKFVMDKTQGVFGKASEFSRSVVNPVRFKMDMTSIDLPKSMLEKYNDEDVIKLEKNDQRFNSLEVTSIKNTSNSFVLHAQSKQVGETIYKGKMSEDQPRGIFHFFVGGPAKGILKKINFEQAGNPLFSTALMRTGQSSKTDLNGDGVIRPSKFTCSMTLVGNPFFYIGQMFYVNTDLISGGAFEKNGILNGGYYVVTEVINVFQADKWETKIRGVLNIPDMALRRKASTGRTLAELSQEERDQVRNIPAPEQVLTQATQVGDNQNTSVSRIG
jgi:hypothetical protein